MEVVVPSMDFVVAQPVTVRMDKRAAAMVLLDRTTIVVVVMSEMVSARVGVVVPANFGYCGCTTKHCANGQTCDRGVGPKSIYCGDGHVGNGICTDGSCCSDYGYCACSEKRCVNGQKCNRTTTISNSDPMMDFRSSTGLRRSSPVSSPPESTSSPDDIRLRHGTPCNCATTR